MNTGSNALSAALTAAGYPTPAAETAPQHCTLSWGTGHGRPEIQVTDAGEATVRARHTPDATFSLIDENQSAEEWIALLHPLIAEPIAHASGTGPVPEPATTVPRDAVVAWLDHDADNAATYAVYTDNARVWVSTEIGIHTASELFGTQRGYQLNITVDTLIPMFTAENGTVMVSRDLSVAAALGENEDWQPALTFRERKPGFIGRALRRNVAQFRGGFRPPTIELSYQGPYDSAGDATGVAEYLLKVSRVEMRAEGHHLWEHLT